MDPSTTLVPATTLDEREAILAEAEAEIRALTGNLGKDASRVPVYSDALQEVNDFRKAVLEFAAFPDVIPFSEASFVEYGWPVPDSFGHLNTYFNFYWVRFPVILKPAPNSSYSKLEYQVEFGANIEDDRLKPKAHLIFPAKQFQELLSLKSSVELGVSGSVGAGASLPTADLEYFTISDAEIEGKAGGEVEVKIGPFDLVMRRAQIDHSAEGAQKVYWQLNDTRLIQTDNPSPIVVLQVPKAVGEIGALAQMQAFHNPTLGRGLTQIYDYLTSKIQNFLNRGAPVMAPPKNWANILPPAG